MGKGQRSAIFALALLRYPLPFVFALQPRSEPYELIEAYD
jgi:hypothetical protein